MTRALVAGTITYLTASLNTVSYLYRHSNERKYGTDILHRGKEMIRSYRQDWYRPAYANGPR